MPSHTISERRKNRRRGAGLGKTLKKVGKAALVTAGIGAAALAGQKAGLGKIAKQTISDVQLSRQLRGALSGFGGGLAGITTVRREKTAAEINAEVAARPRIKAEAEKRLREGGSLVSGSHKRVGSKNEVFDGSARMTSGGLKKGDLMRNKRGKVVSKRMSAAAKKRGGSVEQMAKMRAMRGKGKGKAKNRGGGLSLRLPIRGGRPTVGIIPDIRGRRGGSLLSKALTAGLIDT